MIYYYCSPVLIPNNALCCLESHQCNLVCDLFYFPRLPHPLLINSWTTGLGAHLPLSFTRSRPGGTLTPPQAYIYPGVACATLVGSSLISRCGTRDTCWLIQHLWGVLLPPLLSCTYLQGVPNNLSPIYCQMVVNFIVYLCKRLKLLTFHAIRFWTLPNR